MIDIVSCPNYDKIVNFLYEDNDAISKLLIHHYQDYLLWVKSKESKKKMDTILGEYTEKTDFYRYVQNHFDLKCNNDLLDSYDKAMRKLLKLYRLFETEKTRKVNNARWI